MSHEKSYLPVFPLIYMEVLRLTQNLLKVYGLISAISAHGHLVLYIVFVCLFVLSQSPEE